MFSQIFVKMKKLKAFKYFINEEKSWIKYVEYKFTSFFIVFMLYN